MQVSIYLNDDLIKKIDQIAKRLNKKRSSYIQSVLEKETKLKKNKSVFAEVYGLLDDKTAKEMLHTIRHSRRNSSRFK